MNEWTYSKQGVVVGYPVRERGLSHFQIVQTSCGAQLTYGSMFVGGFFYQRYFGRIVNLTTHLHLVPTVRTSGALPLLPYVSLWRKKNSFNLSTAVCKESVNEENSGTSRIRPR
jgi:hypothetical protein